MREVCIDGMCRRWHEKIQRVKLRLRQQKSEHLYLLVLHVCMCVRKRNCKQKISVSILKQIVSLMLSGVDNNDWESIDFISG